MPKPRIAIIAPPFTTVPPKGQGGTERIAYQMAEGLTQKGYSVTLFGAGECKTSAKFLQIFKKTISEIKFNQDISESSRNLRMESVYIAKTAKEIIKRKKDFDIIINHLRGGFLFLPFSEILNIPVITVLHLPIFPALADFLSDYKKPNIITISNNQRKGFNNVNYLATVYNGVELDEFPFCKEPKDYFLFMGAMGAHKNPKDAVLAAKKANAKLILAGGKKREPYFSEEITPLVDNKKIKYIGEISGKKRINAFQYARALLFPVKIQEPFGLVMAEAMACGTPVIAYANGAVREVIKHNKTGFIVNNTEEMARAMQNIDKIGRKDCRDWVEKNFSNQKMIAEYEKIIKKF